PMAFLLFPAEDVGVYVLPLMIFHIIQLLVCAVIAKHYARLAVEEEERSAPSTTEDGNRSAASTTEDGNRAAPDAGGNSAVDCAESAHRR
ncbi:MAG TPA: bile acid:sodium symporter, partial [Candidatus Brevibacterium intestinavium]|nr:bile acid:sodium symporter [Candidatus Brevibacterium intestinavium]